VRTIDDCQRESAADVSVATTMIEARLLFGPESLFEAMRRALAPERVWPTRDFFEAKVAEQTARHHRYHDTAYNLEPNVKSSPGGLRDIQTIGWVAKRHFGGDSLEELVEHGFLAKSELRKLKAAQAFLWKIRFALHVLTNRREDRLLFDHQIRLAKMFGYEDATYTLAVEQFMQRYYRTAMDVSLLNEMLLQLFREAILSSPNTPPLPVNPRFQIRNDYLEITHDDVFDRYPSALLELFVVIEQNPAIRGVRASTIRQLTRHLWLIDEEFRQHPRNHRLFFEILRAPTGVTHELRRMNLYGVLGRYIPAFGRIVGRMQYDLFHAYTVDAHTLFVVSNLRRLAMPKYDHEFPELSRIMQALPKPELAYVAAIFHDIAKGRGGDHSELGAVDAEAFCLEQGLSNYDARLVAWLVKNHLVLSVTGAEEGHLRSQGDPRVREAGRRSEPSRLSVRADRLRRARHQPEALEQLEVLAVRRLLSAHARGAAPRTGESDRPGSADRRNAVARKGADHSRRPWRKRQCKRSGSASPMRTSCGTRPRRSRGTRRCSRGAMARIAARWCRCSSNRAWRHRHLDLQLASPTQLRAHDGAARSARTYDRRCAHHADGRRLQPRRLSRARRHRRRDQRSRAHSRHPATARTRAVAGRSHRGDVTRRAPRQVRMFSTPTQITFVEDPVNRRTIVELIAGDRPGLLSQIAKVFMAERVDIYNSKIMTVGERAEDVFYVADESGRTLTARRSNAWRSG
jgi:[protein-PII] uridylyltransferase